MLLGIGVYALRQNNLTAIRLRDAVIAADKENKDVEEPLRKLREFVYGHMNADLSSGTGVQHPVQLKYRYERLVAAEKARVDKANGAIYTRAQTYCEKRFPASVGGGGRIGCIEEYVTEQGEKQRAIPDDLYKFDFVSPRWSPDVAGLSLLFSAVCFFLFIVRFGLYKWMQHELHSHE